MSKVSDRDLDALLDADGGDDPVALFARIHARRRQRAHAKEKESQPELGIREAVHRDGPGCACNGCLLEAVREFLRTPLTEGDHDAAPGAIDQLLHTVQETLDAGDFEDAVFAAFRIVRKVWAWNSHHLGPIQGIPAVNLPEERSGG